MDVSRQNMKEYNVRKGKRRETMKESALSIPKKWTRWIKAATADKSLHHDLENTSKLSSGFEVSTLIFNLFYTVENNSKNPKYFIRMYWTIFWQAFAHVKQSILGKLLTKICSPDLYASLVTFWVQIGQVFDPPSVFKNF